MTTNEKLLIVGIVIAAVIGGTEGYARGEHAGSEVAYSTSVDVINDFDRSLREAHVRETEARDDVLDVEKQFAQYRHDHP